MAEINGASNKKLAEEDLDLIPPLDIRHFCARKNAWHSSWSACTQTRKEELAFFFNKYASKLVQENKNFEHFRKIIVSLTSYGSRIKTVHKVVETLKNQSLKAAKIILWLAENEIGAALDKLPSELTSLIDQNFEIRFCADLKSYKKLIPTLKLYWNSIIVTADDDQYYNPHWLLELFLSWLEYPDAIHCHRGHKAVFSYGQLEKYAHWNFHCQQSEPSYLIFPTGVGGILYPPESFTREIFNEEYFMKKCQTGDDIWFWVMAIMKNRMFRVVPLSSFQSDPVESSQDSSLYNQNIKYGYNDRMLKQIMFYYPFVRRKLLKIYYSQ